MAHAVNDLCGTIHVSDDLANTLTGHFSGYVVRLHGYPSVTFHIDLPVGCTDQAHRVALRVAGGRNGSNSGATIQRQEEG